jgi:hypothetical protein
MAPIVRIVSVALLSIALLAGPTSAECAWVLWEEIEFLGQGRSSTTDWAFKRVIHDTRKACESALPGAMNDAVSVWSSLGHSVIGRGEDGPKSGSIVFKEQASRRVTAGARGDDGNPLWVRVSKFYCFPATLDPRGPRSN